MAEYVTKLDLVEQVLRELIASGEIQPGERLRQSELAERVGTSQTPVREALRRLEADGLIVSRPHQGVRVAEVIPEEMAELYLIRARLEGLAVEHAVPNVTQQELKKLITLQDHLEAARASGNAKPLRKLNYDFHTRLYRLSNLARLNKIIDSLWPLFPWDTMLAIPGRVDSSAREHRAILDAVVRVDTKAAREAMEGHIESGAEAFLRFRATDEAELPGQTKGRRDS
jgi:DNA-binding GntR family transcriptional regulator